VHGVVVVAVEGVAELWGKEDSDPRAVPGQHGAGASHCSKADQGWGVVNLNTMEWARGSWPAYILENSVHHGAQWGRRLSFLEGFT
jgi:hypothetical protein